MRQFLGSLSSPMRTFSFTRIPALRPSRMCFVQTVPGSIHVASNDPGKPPAIRFNFLSAQSDRDILLESMRITRRIMNAGPMKDVARDEMAPGVDVASDDDLLEWIKHNAETTYHPVGTCKMGNDPMAVVDDQLKVHGIDALRVVMRRSCRP